jgi:hypothetical protein
MVRREGPSLGHWTARGKCPLVASQVPLSVLLTLPWSHVPLQIGLRHIRKWPAVSSHPKEVGSIQRPCLGRQDRKEHLMRTFCMLPLQVCSSLITDGPWEAGLYSYAYFMEEENRGWRNGIICPWWHHCWGQILGLNPDIWIQKPFQKEVGWSGNWSEHLGPKLLRDCLWESNAKWRLRISLGLNFRTAGSNSIQLRPAVFIWNLNVIGYPLFFQQH